MKPSRFNSTLVTGTQALDFELKKTVEEIGTVDWGSEGTGMESEWSGVERSWVANPTQEGL